MNDSNNIKSENILVEKLMNKGLRISCAESCTGGLLMAKIVSVPSASSVFDAGFVTYSEEMKCRLLGIEPEIIKIHGVVSEETAAAMAQGAVQKTGADIGIGITGLAGPSGGSKALPVGTVCFGFFIQGITTTKIKHFGDLGRNIVRELSADYAIDVLSELIDEFREKQN